MSTFKHYRRVAAAICVVGFLTQGNAVAGPNPLGANYCTNDTTCLQFRLTNSTNQDLYIAIETDGENCYGPSPKSKVLTGSQSDMYDIPDDNTCQTLSPDKSFLNLYSTQDGSSLQCRYSLTQALANVTSDSSYLATYMAVDNQNADDDGDSCVISQVVGLPSN